MKSRSASSCCARWGYYPAVLTRTVDTHIAELRRKLEIDPACPRRIITVRKAGHRPQA